MKKITRMVIKTGIYNEWSGVELIDFNMSLNEFARTYDLNNTNIQFFYLQDTKGDRILNKNCIVDIQEIEVEE